MKLFFVIGWLLLASAFLAAAADISVKVSRNSGGALLSAIDLWNSVSPDTLIATRSLLSDIHPALWDPLLTTLLILPAWLLLGLPGGVLAYLCRPNRRDDSLEGGNDDDMTPHSLYEELAKAAKDEGYGDSVDDMAPNVGKIDYGHSDAALGRGRVRSKQEDMGEASADFANELSKRAKAEGYTEDDHGRSRRPAAPRPSPPPFPGGSKPSDK